MKIPFKYMVKNFRTRRISTLITLAGIALVIFVFSAVLMLANGVKKTLVATGSPDNAVIVRKGSNGEISSIIVGATQDVISTLPYIAKTPDGSPAISYQPVVVINLTTPDGSLTNVTVRGVSQATLYLHPDVKIIEGRMFNPALREVIVGESVAKRYPEAHLGGSIKLAGDYWKVVGVFSNNGSGFESEIWCDYHQIQDAFHRGSSVSSITVKLDNPSDFDKFKQAFTSDRRLQEFEPKPEQQYFGEQSETLATFIKVVGTMITIIFSFGAAIGAMITMYAEVSNRTVEIGTLRALGFSRRSVLVVFLLEAILISFTGGLLGITIASLLQFVSVSTMNFTSFSELTFSFALTPASVVGSMIFAVLMGILGGFLPSARAARLNIVSALRGG
ncbi:MAG: ABC transporter permease [Candidatus Kryptoniota bacterium]